ncbi:albumin-like [Pleurodeles waltl]
MMWVTLILVVILQSSTESRTLMKRDVYEPFPEAQNALEVDRNVGDVFNILGKEKFHILGIIMFSQYLQKCSYEKQVERVKDITELAQKCSTGIKTPECRKSVITVALDVMCKTLPDPEMYPAHTECCTKLDPDRNVCFLSHKITNLDTLSPYEKPEPEEVCKGYKEDPAIYVEKYLYEVVRRFSSFFSSRILAFADRFEKIVMDCCKDAVVRGQCFPVKMPALAKELQQTNSLDNNYCRVIDKYGERTFKSIAAIHLSQRFPKASFKAVLDMTQDFAHKYLYCCHGDTMQCWIDMMDVASRICVNQDNISSKLKECCEKDLTERLQCILKMENDEKPADLSPRELIEHPEICEHFEDHLGQGVNRFTYEYSRRHQDFSAQLIQQISDGYQELVVQCCKTNSSECFTKGEELMKKKIAESQNILKKNCEDLQKIGNYNLNNKLLIQYTKTIPQLESKSLIEVSQSMTEVADACCKVKEGAQMSCFDSGVDMVLGDICQMQEGFFLNAKVSHCCSVSYTKRRQCFSALEMDDSYTPQPFSPDLFKLRADSCVISSPRDLKNKKQTFLVQLVKLKLNIEDYRRNPIIAAFLSMMDRCCKADDKEECFLVEEPKLIEMCQHIFETKNSIQEAA